MDYEERLKNYAYDRVEDELHKTVDDIAKPVSRQVVKFSDVTIDTGYGITYEVADVTLPPNAAGLVQSELRQSKNLLKDNMGKGLDGATNEIMHQTVTSLMSVMRDKKSLDEASREIAAHTKETVKNVVIYNVKSVAKKEAERWGRQAANYAVKKAGLQCLKSGASAFPITEALVLGDMLKDSVINLLDGKINEEQFIQEVSRKATVVAVQLACAPLPGGLIISMVMTSACQSLFSLMDAAKNQVAADRRKRIQKIAEEALVEMNHQRKLMEQYIEEDREKFDSNVKKGFNLIFNGMYSNDVEGIADGLNVIMSNFGKQAAFSKYEEFDDFFMDNDTVFKL